MRNLNLDERRQEDFSLLDALRAFDPIEGRFCFGVAPLELATNPEETLRLRKDPVLAPENVGTDSSFWGWG